MYYNEEFERSPTNTSALHPSYTQPQTVLLILQYRQSVEDFKTKISAVLMKYEIRRIQSNYISLLHFLYIIFNENPQKSFFKSCKFCLMKFQA